MFVRKQVYACTYFELKMITKSMKYFFQMGDKMLEHTVSENQYKNKYGHNTKNSCKNGRQCCTSEKGKHHKLGNSA